VGDHDVLTAHHVISCEGIGVAFIETRKGEIFQASVLVSIPADDLAVLTTPAKLPYVEFAWADTSEGEVVCLEAAVPDFARKCGEVLDKNSRLGADITHTAHVQQGNSGAGTWSAEGKLIGIVTRKWENNILQNRGGVSVSVAQHKQCLLALDCR